MSRKNRLTRNLKVRPFLGRAAEVVDVLEEITAAGHEEFITAFFCVAAGVKLYRQIDGPWDVHLVLKEKRRHRYSLQTNCAEFIE